jgi:hypothetical protein
VIEPHLTERLAEGYEIVQRGRVDIPWDPNAKPKPTFADRVSDCRVSEIQSGDALLDDDQQWVHLRKPRV